MTRHFGKWAVLASVAAVSALWSCAHLPPEERLADEAQGDEGPRVGEVTARTAVLYPDGNLVGFDTRLSRSGGGARGVLFGRTVDVQFTPDSMVGHVDSVPVRVNVKRENGLRLLGTLESLPVDLQITETTWTGRLQGCDVQLRRVEHGFLGSSSCRPLKEPTILIVFPRELDAAPLPEQLLYVGLSVRAS